MHIILLGSKEYPFGSSHTYDSKAGGGIEAHVDQLSAQLIKQGHTVTLITRCFPNQPRVEKQGRLHIHRTRYISHSFLRAFTFNILAGLLTLRLIHRQKIDLVHTHGPIAGIIGVILHFSTRIPHFFTPHGTVTGWPLPLKKILHLLERCSVAGSTQTLFVSKIAYQELRRSRDVLLSNAVDVSSYTPTKKTWRGMRFLFLGRLEPIKGIQSYTLLLARHW